MNWFYFLKGINKRERSVQRSVSLWSNSNASTDFGPMESGPQLNGLNSSDISAGSVERSPYPCFAQKPDNLRVFTYHELKNATKNFSRSVMIGEGGFGSVYRGTIRSLDDSHMKIDIAVKQLNRKGLQGHKEWSAEVNVLGVAEHPNLVKLIGYCAEDDERGIQRLLVYEFMPNRSVEDHLSTKSTTTLSWSMRLKIALDAAHGLTYLHEGMDFQIIFRDLKTSNILLDEEWNAKLSDFGLARHGPSGGLSYVSTAVVGTVGYAAPEYMQTGRLTPKSDVWSYGVVLYELITGRPPVDRNRPKGEQKMLEWVKPYISEKKFALILDPRLDGQYSLKSAQRLGMVANKCLSRHPKSRPKMSEVLEMVKRVVDKTETGPPQPPLLSCPTRESLEDTKRTRYSLKRRFNELKAPERWFQWRKSKSDAIGAC